MEPNRYRGHRIDQQNDGSFLAQNEDGSETLSREDLNGIMLAIDAYWTPAEVLANE